MVKVSFLAHSVCDAGYSQHHLGQSSAILAFLKHYILLYIAGILYLDSQASKSIITCIIYSIRTCFLLCDRGISI